MNELWLYSGLSRKLPVRYGTKVMCVAFAGTHVPLLALIGYFIWTTAPSLAFALRVLAVALVATLAGTALTLLALSHLLRPIILTSRALRGYLANRTLPALPTMWTDEVGTLMADTARTITQLDGALEELAYFDPATGLPNRDRLLQVLGGRQRAGDGFMLCVLVQHSHERVAAAFGQQPADAVMRALAQALEDALERGTTLARIAPDRFAFILPPGDARVATLLAALPREIAAAGAVCMADYTAGVALSPADGATPEALLNAALAAVPASGAGERTAFYAVASHDAARELLALERDLRRALERDEFCLHYQPVFSLRTGRIVSAEALIRWQHPQHGLIQPGRFIHAVESSGLSDAVGMWVLRAACRQLQTWSAQGLEELRVAINLSAGQFRHPELVGTISGALDAHGVAPSRLEIELTETTMMDDTARTRALFGRLHDIGVTTSIDDFGTGYSSLSYLKSLPFDKLKIDRCFVTGVDTARDSQAICGALIELSRGLGITVQAEGTETAAEVAALQRLGCDLFQGYYFARPLPVEGMASRLRAQGGGLELATVA
jgi:EAL domain-containing protein (putative c-di-GMP-specific phosphodiesterase class I)/GGDEF domain-containing protein